MHLPTKTRDFAPPTPEIDENDENGGCYPDKMAVCQKHRFDNPSKRRVARRRFSDSKRGFGVRPRQGTEICNFGAPSPLDYFELSSVDFSTLSPDFLCTIAAKIITKKLFTKKMFWRN